MQIDFDDLQNYVKILRRMKAYEHEYSRRSMGGKYPVDPEFEAEYKKALYDGLSILDIFSDSGIQVTGL